ncbi:MAG: 3-hydroxyacyl-CoA dehydrogenase family protein [Burkholderiaceae bacterium]
MQYSIKQVGVSRAFSDGAEGDKFLANAVEDGEIVVYLGAKYQPDPSKVAVLIELDNECLGEHTGEDAGREGSNALGFNRFRNGSDEPSNLIELVRQPATAQTALAAARHLFESAGFEVAVCADQAGRIINRLVRPKYNYALRFLDEGLASAEDMDLTCRMGLGYADGPIERLERGGLDNHYDVTSALFEIYGTPAYAPARRATVARRRADKTGDGNK